MVEKVTDDGDLIQVADGDDLTEAVRGLSKYVKGLRDEVRGEQEDRRRSIARIIAGVALGAVLLALAFFTGLRAAYDRIDQRVDANTASIADQIEADCPGHKLLGEAEIRPWTTQLGRDLLLSERRRYEEKCLGKDGFGPLEPADPDLSRPIQPSPTPSPRR